MVQQKNPLKLPLRLMETFRSVFYTPIYVAVAGGFLENSGLDVTFSTCPSQYPHPLSALNHGAADIVQSGIMRSIIAADWGAESVPAHFAKINSRDGFFVLSRRPIEAYREEYPGEVRGEVREEFPGEFRWESLLASIVIPVGFSPMPWASFQSALRKHGVEPGQLDLMTGLSLDQAVAAFRDGQAEFIHLPQPAVEHLLTEGWGHLAIALGPENGHIAYSSFAATNRFLAENRDLVSRFMEGYSQALRWLAANEATEIAKAVAPFFDQMPQELITMAISRYQAQDTWPHHPALAEPEYQGLQDILIGAGLVGERQPYEKVVRPEFAEALGS